MKVDMKKLKKPKSKDILAEEETEEKSERRELLKEQIVMKLRLSEKRILEELAEKTGLKLSPLIRSLLKKHDYI